jgi:hypothetical protein
MHTWYIKIFVHKSIAEALFNCALVEWCTLMSEGCLLIPVMLATMIIAEEYRIEAKNVSLFFTSL